MSLPIRFRRTATTEYEEAQDWYEARRTGNGERFLAAVEKVIDGLAIAPTKWPEAWPDVRRAPVRKWPYCVYYTIRPDHILVVGVFHNSRDSGELMTRM
ncbi:MAG: type II toxin-antitoxin system RelE/ParE family toxin [Fimbriiglobus sp.]